jgi:hypothetical protein
LRKLISILNQEFDSGAEYIQPGDWSGFGEPFASTPERSDFAPHAEDAPALAPRPWNRSPCGQETGECDAILDEQSITTGGRFKTGDHRFFEQ